MALIYFLILICEFSTVLCDECNPGDDKVIVQTYVLYLIGFAMLFKFLIIISLCFRLYKNKTDLIYENQTPVLEKCRRDESSQTLYSGITEIKELLDEPTMDIRLEENKKPVIVKRTLGLQTPVISKQQMNKIVQEVLKRKPRSPSCSDNDLKDLIDGKSMEVKSLFGRKSNIIDKSEDVEVDFALHGNYPVRKDSASSLKTETLDKNINKNTNIETRKEYDGASETLAKTVEDVNDVLDTLSNPEVNLNEVNDTLPNPVDKEVEIYDTVPSQVVKVEDFYDTVPNLQVKANNFYDTVPKIQVKVNDLYDTVPNLLAEVKNVYDTAPNSVQNADDIYDTVPNVIKMDVFDTIPVPVNNGENNVNEANVNVTVDSSVPSNPKQVKRRALIDNASDYTLLIMEDTENARYINVNDI